MKVPSTLTTKPSDPTREPRYINVNRATVNELRKLLRDLQRAEIGE